MPDEISLYNPKRITWNPDNPAELPGKLFFLHQVQEARDSSWVGLYTLLPNRSGSFCGRARDGYAIQGRIPGDDDHWIDVRLTFDTIEEATKHMMSLE